MLPSHGLWLSLVKRSRPGHRPVPEYPGLATRLGELDVEEGAIDEMAAQAAEQWTAQFNPIAADKAALAELYRSAM